MSEKPQYLAFQPFTFPSGKQVKNRIVKASMEENMAGSGQLPSQELIELYRTWAKGGTGLLLTGNVMIDKLAMTGPGGVALEKNTDLKQFKKWAKAAKQNNTKVWMQISHPGRQVYKKMQGKVYAPSAVPLNMGSASKLFGAPIPMSETQILNVIERFATTAFMAEEAGFDGVQIHAAHGYLLSQFLSPLVNKRKDKWGGSLQNRARLLFEVIKAVQDATSENFSVAIKINSADFQKGGFENSDLLTLLRDLDEYNLDMIEVSGGSYEAPAMQGVTADGQTLAREAYFFDFADIVAKHCKTPIMTTGGIRRLQIVEKVLASKVEFVGIATGLATTPDLVNRWQIDADFEANYPKVNWKNKTLRALATMASVKRNLRRLGAGKSPASKTLPLWSFVKDQFISAKLTKRYLNEKNIGK